MPARRLALHHRLELRHEPLFRPVHRGVIFLHRALGLGGELGVIRAQCGAEEHKEEKEVVFHRVVWGVILLLNNWNHVSKPAY